MNSLDLDWEIQKTILINKMKLGKNTNNYDNILGLIESTYNYIVNHIKNDVNQKSYLKRLINISIIIQNYPRRIIRKDTKTQSDVQLMLLLCV